MKGATSRATRRTCSGTARLHRLSTPRIASQNTDGTGCTFSAAIVAGLARGQALGDAIRSAKAYVTRRSARAFRRAAGWASSAIRPGLVMSEPEASASPDAAGADEQGKMSSSTT